ncbi:odorant receptor Or1 isoform X2 [Cephus cinctus]|uniref:Odorant receptor n=1 Tax=Cephus cinctus TaxID=211228 RepID=A0AAJ7CDW4_CEPCN|nr:odorant receptor Or1 isoform X2 [Cephus cinctus]
MRSVIAAHPRVSDSRQLKIVGRRNDISDMEILPLCFKLWTIGGFWRPLDYYSPMSKFLYNCYSFVSFLGLYSLMLFEFLDIVFNFGNLDDFTSIAFMFMTVLSDCLKAANTLGKRSRIIEIQDMLTDETCIAHDTEEQMILERSAKVCRSNTQYLGILIMSFVVFLFVGSLLFNVNERILPVKVWLPYSLSSLTSFSLSYLYQIWVSMLAAFMATANDTYITGLMIQICAQLDILKYRLLSLPRSGDSERNANSSVSQKEIILKMCIRHHNHIIKVAATVEETFSSIIFFQCFVSTTVICVATFILLKSDFMSVEFIITLMYFPPLLFELLIYCWYGNEVTLKSTEIRDAVFEMDWIPLPVSMKKDLILVILRAGRTIKFTSAYVLTLSLDSFMAVSPPAL